MSQITRDNHFVPQLYLKQWSRDHYQIWSYRLLVSHKSVAKWKLRPIRGVAFHRDLYTSILDGKEVDGFEKWMESEFEEPAQESINKVVKNKLLKLSDWERLARFLAAQDVRTPRSYLESVERWQSTLPTIMENTIRRSIEEYKNNLKNGEMPEVPEVADSPLFQELLKVNVVPNPNMEEGGSVIEAKMMVGRSFWLKSQHFLLKNTAKNLLNHKWSIVNPATGLEWFTSDHPVVRLNYYKEGSYDLKGGWGVPGGNLFMPISPNHLLFTQIGSDLPDKFTFSRVKTREIQKFLAERALRWIFSKQPMKIVEKYRPRKVDFETYKNEEEQIKRWHVDQILSEK